MTKITVDKALIEQAIDTIGYYASVAGEDDQDTPAKQAQAALRAALAEPAADPVGWSITWHGDHTGNFYQSRETAEVRMIEANQKYPGEVRAIAPLFASPPPPAEVPLTTEEYTALAHRIASKYAHRSDPKHIAYTFLPHTLEQFVREIEKSVRRKAGLK